MTTNPRLMALVVAGVVLFAATSHAQEPSRLVPAPNTYGTADLVSYVVSAWEFEFVTTGVGATTLHAPGGRYFTSPGLLRTGIHLPNGASIQAIEIQGCDTSATGALTLSLSSYTVLGSSAFETVHGSLISGAAVSSTDGCQTWSAPVNVVVNNSVNSYFVGTSAGTMGTANTLHAIRVYYRLQVSPTPGTATFADVPVGHPFHRFVEALVAAGITGGCGGGNYCPTQPVTRGQMAVFLAAALGLHWPN